MRRAAITVGTLLALTVHAESRQHPVLRCDFAGEKLVLHQNTDRYGVEIGGQTFPATLAQPGPTGRFVAVFAMLDAGPVMIAVATSDPGSDGAAVHPSEITASQVGAKGLATRTTEGTCTEAAP